VKPKLRNIFLFLLPLYTLTFGWTFKGYGARVFDLAQDLVEKGQLGVFQVGVAQIGLSGFFYGVGKVAGSLTKTPWLPLYTSFLVSPFVVALTAYLVSYTALKMFKSEKVAIILGLIFGLTTLAWPYSKIGMEDLLGLGIVLSFLAAYSLKTNFSKKNFALFILGLVIVTNSKLYGIVFVPAFLVYSLLNILSNHKLLKTDKKRRALGVTIVGTAVPLIILALSNYLRMGSFLKTAYPSGTGVSFFGAKGQIIPFWIALYGIVFSAGKSFFLYNPPLILGLLHLRKFTKRFRAETLLLGLLALSFFIIIAPLSAWSDEVWGIRYLYPLLPLLVLPLGKCIQEFQSFGRLKKIGAATILTLGFYIQILGISFDYHDYIHILGTGNVNYSQYIQFIPELSPIRIHHKLLLSGLKNNLPFLPLKKQVLTYEIYQTIGLGEPGRVLIDNLDLGDYAKFDFWWKLEQGPTKIGKIEYPNPNFGRERFVILTVLGTMTLYFGWKLRNAFII